jgi:hypothetical protein
VDEDPTIFNLNPNSSEDGQNDHEIPLLVLEIFLLGLEDSSQACTACGSVLVRLENREFLNRSRIGTQGPAP